MPFHFENNIGEDKEKGSEYRKIYGQGYTARLEGEKIEEMPFEDLKSPEAEAWLDGFNEAGKSEEMAKFKKSKEEEECKEKAFLEEKKKNEEIAKLEEWYKK